MSAIQKKRTRAFERQGGRCWYCGAPMWRAEDEEEFFARYNLSRKIAGVLQCTAEHLRARCDGGGNGKGNIVAACLYCNQTRHRTSGRAPEPAQYRQFVRRRLKKGEWHPGRIAVLCKPA